MSFSEIRVALIEDHQMFRDGISSILSDAPSIGVVLQCQNGQEFLNYNGRDVDVVLLDLDMPVKNGLQTLEELNNRKSREKVIFVSQNKSPLQIKRLMDLGARGYLTKETSAEELVNAIYSVNETGYYFNDLVNTSLLIGLAKRDDVQPIFNYSETLTKREQEILELICQENTTREIAETLFLSSKTVENYRNRLLEKTGVRNTAGLVVFAIKNHLIHLNG